MPPANGIHGHLLAIRGRENHLDVGPNLLQFCKDILAAHPRQGHVEQNHAYASFISAEEVHRGKAVAGLEY